MRTDDVFNDIDSKTADRLAKEYPVLRDEQKERLYAMSKRKFDIKIDNSSIDVSGVEKYRRPKWYKGVSVAAAALLLVAGIGGSMYYISRNGKAPAAEVEESISETTEVTTEALTEEQTEAEIDADAIAKGLIDDYREFMCVLYGGDLEVDKSDIITRAITIPDNDVTFDREFYRVTDTRFPTWADIEKRCYEILDTELAHRILEISTENTEDIMGNPFFCVTEDGYYVETGLHDNGIDPLSTSEYDMNVHTDDSGNIIATIAETELREVHDYPIPETTFTIVETPNGWRISDVTEKPLDEENDNSTDADAIAKELTGAYRDFSNDLHGGNLEVDKNNVVTKTIISSDGVEHQREFYLVTDLRYPTWADIEKRCFEIFDEKFGKVVLDNCMCDKEDDINYDTFMYTTDNGYYIEKSVHDDSMGPHDWDEDIVNAETDENGNIITVLHRSGFDGAGYKYTVETVFTITNTENGWRISDVTEKPVEENE